MKNRYLVFITSVLFDLFAAAVSIFISFKLIGVPEVPKGGNIFVFSLLIWPTLMVLSFYIFKTYSVLWRFSRISDLLRLFVGMVVALGALFICQMAVYGKAISAPAMLLTFFLAFFLTVVFRLCMKDIILRVSCREAAENNSADKLKGNIMIIGAGCAASMIINELRDNKVNNCKFKCAIDDDPAKKNTYILGIKVYGDRNSIIEAAEKFQIDTILFAIPSCDNKEKGEILNICKETGCELKIVPSIYQMMNSGEKGISKKIRKVQIEDLLGREPISLDINRIIDYVAGRTVLVTGGGTIGSELCRQIAEHDPKRLVIFDIYENNAYDIQNELRRKYPELDLVTLIGSVRDSKRLESVFKTYRPDIVYHAAAHKHVPLMEDSPNEAIKNNVFGTLKTAQCADKYGAKKFVLISTDKAVNPTNIMGASKRMCEMIIQSYNKRSETEFVAVRFGNVLGSNGSVIPLFKKQIEAGGPVTVTDPDIIRYFMTIPEAVTLVLQAGASAKGGEIFVLDMGKPVKILTLAENLIRLSGFTPHKDIKIEFIGLRPGEKLYEEMLMAEEGLKETENKLIHIGQPIEFDENEFFAALDNLRKAMYDDTVDMRAIVSGIVPTYHCNKT